VTLGANGFYQTNRSGVFDGGGYPTYWPMAPWGVFNINDPHAGHTKARDSHHFDNYLGLQKASVTYNSNLVIGDDIKFNDKWSVLIGLNYSTISLESWDAGDPNSVKYKKSAATPTFSLLYKPIPNVTTYASYIESLENGGIVGQSSGGRDYTNAGEIMKPTISQQYEVGVKAEINQLLLTAALFKIDKSNIYDQINPNNTVTRTQDGRQIHQGVEITAQGKLVKDLTIFGGFTYLDTEITKVADPRLRHKSPNFIYKSMAKLYTEYDLPFIEGLVLNAGVYHFSSVYANTYNTNKISGFTLVDLGARFTTELFGGVETIFQLNVNNVGDKAYWTSQALGVPRSVVFTVSAVF
jgi:iron complex outermembrane receptor protein